MECINVSILVRRMEQKMTLSDTFNSLLLRVRQEELDCKLLMQIASNLLFQNYCFKKASIFS